MGIQGSVSGSDGNNNYFVHSATLAPLLQQLNQESPNLDSMTQTVRDSFAMSSKVLDQIGRTGVFTISYDRKPPSLSLPR